MRPGPAGSLVLILAISLAGCSYPATIEGMTLAEPERVKQHPYAVQVAAYGGPETSRGDSPGAISNDDLEQAIVASIEAAGLFSEVVQTGVADYLLTATLVHVRKPIMGFTMTADVEVSWKLSDPGSKKTVWQQTLRSSHTAGVGEAFSGATRVRIVTEGAIRDNVKEALHRIAELDLRPISAASATH